MKYWQSTNEFGNKIITVIDTNFIIRWWYQRLIWSACLYNTNNSSKLVSWEIAHYKEQKKERENEIL
jgi:hypothetical protein